MPNAAIQEFESEQGHLSENQPFRIHDAANSALALIKKTLIVCCPMTLRLNDYSTGVQIKKVGPGQTQVVLYAVFYW